MGAAAVLWLQDIQLNAYVCSKCKAANPKYVQPENKLIAENVPNEVTPTFVEGTQLENSLAIGKSKLSKIPRPINRGDRINMSMREPLQVHRSFENVIRAFTPDGRRLRVDTPKCLLKVSKDIGFNQPISEDCNKNTDSARKEEGEIIDNELTKTVIDGSNNVDTCERYNSITNLINVLLNEQLDKSEKVKEEENKIPNIITDKDSNDAKIVKNNGTHQDHTNLEFPIEMRNINKYLNILADTIDKQSPKEVGDKANSSDSTPSEETSDMSTEVCVEVIKPTPEEILPKSTNSKKVLGVDKSATADVLLIPTQKKMSNSSTHSHNVVAEMVNDVEKMIEEIASNNRMENVDPVERTETPSDVHKIDVLYNDDDIDIGKKVDRRPQTLKIDTPQNIKSTVLSADHLPTVNIQEIASNWGKISSQNIVTSKSDSYSQAVRMFADVEDVED